MDLNVNAMMNGIIPVVEIMKEQGGGCILNTSSMVSICGQPSGVAYPASKYAVNGLTWSLARELGPFHIRVNAVAPGITKTDMVAGTAERDDRAAGKPDSVTKDWRGGGYCECVFVSRQ